MSDPRWFKLLVRGIGLLLFGQAFPQLANGVAYAIMTMAGQAGVSTRWYWTSGAAYFFGGLLQALFGLYLLFGAPRLVRYCIGQVGHRCPACDYDIRGIKDACPECGLALTPAQAGTPGA